MSDQILTSTVPIIVERMKRGVEFRFIFPETIVPPPGVKPEPGAKKRMLPKVEEVISMTETEAMFGFPDLNGKIDYALLIGKDPNSHKYCKTCFYIVGRKLYPLLYHCKLLPLQSSRVT